MTKWLESVLINELLPCRNLTSAMRKLVLLITDVEPSCEFLDNSLIM